MFSPQTDDSTLQELKKYYNAVMPMTNPAMDHNPHMPAAENQRGKLKSEWKCMLSSRIFQLFPSIKTGFFDDKVHEDGSKRQSSLKTTAVICKPH